MTRWRQQLAGSTLVTSLVWLCLIFDAGVGLIWAASSSQRLSGPVYDVARMLVPMQAYGALFLAYAAGGVITLRLVPRNLAAYMIGGAGGAVWTFWVILFGAAALSGSRPVSALGAWFALGMVTLHVLTGLAMPRGPRCGRE